MYVIPLFGVDSQRQYCAVFNHILSSLKIRANCVGYRRCRNIDLYDVALDPGGRVRDLEKFSQEIGLSLRSKTVPLIKPQLDEGVVRVQIIADEPSTIDFVDEVDLSRSPDVTLPFYLGSTFDDKSLWIDLHTAPHILVAGTSGSGKSTLLHTIIGNAFRLQKFDTFLIDTKNIEFSAYSERSDVSISTSYIDAVEVLQHLYGIMEDTYASMRANNLPANHFAIAKNETYRLIVIDEFADLIMQDNNDRIYDLVCKIAQKGRAAGIHIVLATQRPSVDVIPGTVKANFPTRIACRVASKTDSNVILDAPHAYNLLGKGDALLKSNQFDLLRFQSAFATAQKNCEVY